MNIMENTSWKILKKKKKKKLEKNPAKQMQFFKI